MTNWLEKIAKERAHQINLGYTPEHDDTHKSGQIANHASALATTWLTCAEIMYPYSDTAIKDGFKNNSRIKQLVKAGALIVAELERLERLEKIDKMCDEICREARKLNAVCFLMEEV